MCNKCQLEKPYDKFVKNINFPDGIWVYCKDCHKQWRPKTLPEMKRTKTHKECRICRKMKVFYDYEAGNTKNHTYCSSCRKIKGFEANLERYGLTPEQYVEMETKQGGVCAVCKQPEKEKKRLSIDHDHQCCFGIKSCGKCVRGLVCTRCNKGMGVFGDNIDVLKAAVNYLIKYTI